MTIESDLYIEYFKNVINDLLLGKHGIWLNSVYFFASEKGEFSNIKNFKISNWE